MAHPARHLNTAAEQIRAWNHATIDPGPGWKQPGDTYTALGHLAHMARMLPQAIQQTIQPVIRTHRDGRVVVDGGRDAEQAVAAVRAAMAEAADAGAALAEALDRLHSATSPLGLDTRGLPEFEDDE